MVKVCTTAEDFSKHFAPALQHKLRDLYYGKSNGINKILLDFQLKDRRPIAITHNSVYTVNKSLASGYDDVCCAEVLEFVLFSKFVLDKVLILKFYVSSGVVVTATVATLLNWSLFCSSILGVIGVEVFAEA